MPTICIGLLVLFIIGIFALGYSLCRIAAKSDEEMGLK